MSQTEYSPYLIKLMVDLEENLTISYLRLLYIYRGRSLCLLTCYCLQEEQQQPEQVNRLLSAAAGNTNAAGGGGSNSAENPELQDPRSFDILMTFMLIKSSKQIYFKTIFFFVCQNDMNCCEL